ncbi:hypothetical protein MTBPR1_30286 [Candidatus Terasakiella magnetica]|uniref:Uncharacterized protein n=1 Tax=Candidatus Terasakiella magnetica TaxID=1867952 RepID=A0A1C3RI19_9PROT|nr:hypothetical protein [Candidatus Terasakiella magnetica]SCA56916.1 hypothetical protein MTBPR1_30286 [Candidatus Terasakiella magnetica]
MWDIIIAICLVAVVCLPVWAICRYLRVDLPKFVLPMLAGISLLSFNAYMRYTWGDRTAEAFPPEVVVLKEYRHSNLFEPWTFLWPRVSHLIAADTTQTRTNPAYPDIIMGSTVMMQEHQDTTQMSVLVNCKKGQVAVLPTKAIAQGVNPIETAAWADRSDFPFIAGFYCK